MPKPQQARQKPPEEPMDTQEQTTAASADILPATAPEPQDKPVKPLVEQPTSLSLVSQRDYEDAMGENRRMDFGAAILAARTPKVVEPHRPPPVAPRVMEQTLLEMEAGRKRVAEATEREVERKAIHELHKNDKWQQPKSEAVFRPADYVPDQRKGQGNVGGNSANV